MYLSVGRSSKIIPSGGKRLVQTLISDVAKKMRMSSNLAKRKREEQESAHWEDEWKGELYSNSRNYVTWNQYVNGEVPTFGQVPVSMGLHGQSTVSNIGEISKVEESCFENISGPAETLKIEGELEVSTNLDEYSCTLKVKVKTLKSKF